MVRYPVNKLALLVSALLDTLFIERMKQSKGIFARFMNERDFKSVVAEWVSRAVYGRLRRGPEGSADSL